MALFLIASVLSFGLAAMHGIQLERYASKGLEALSLVSLLSVLAWVSIGAAIGVSGTLIA